MIVRLQVQIPAGVVGELSSQGQLFMLAYFSIHSTSKSAVSRFELNTQAPYVCGFAWSDMVHGCMVYTERAEMAAVSCGTSHANAVSTPLRWIFKNVLWEAIHSCRVTCECSESARERRIALYKSDQQQRWWDSDKIEECLEMTGMPIV